MDSEGVDVGAVTRDTYEVHPQDLQPLRGDYGRTQKGDSYDIGELFYPEICGDTGDSAAWLRASCDG
jgi:hypothetical protein